MEKSYKEIAEQYVKSKRSHLMELTFGCEVECTYKPNKSLEAEKERTRMIMVGEEDRDEGIDGGLYNFVRNLEYVGWTTENSEWWKIVKIIGHRPQLQDWLGAFDNAEGKPEGYYYYMLDGSMHYEAPGKPQYVLFKFDRDTGQPNSPEDYKAFNDIVGINV